MALFDLCRMTVSSSGTGTITLNAAVSGFLTFDQAGCSTASAGQVVTYAIADTGASEIGSGTYRSSSLSLTRGSTSGPNKIHSTNSNSPINMSNAAVVLITPAAANMPAFIHFQSFTANSSYIPTTGMVYCIIECVGGGGGGAGATVVSTVGADAGGGGGAGAYGRKFCSAADIGASKTVTIGAAGTGGVGIAGTAGGATSLGALCTAGGGNAGLAGAGGHTGGAGGAAGTADVAIPGQNGLPGGFRTTSVSERFASGAGASTIFGAGGAAAAAFIGAINGGNAAGYGSGGGGGAIQASSTLTATGGDGSAGFVLIAEFGSQ